MNVVDSVFATLFKSPNTPNALASCANKTPSFAVMSPITGKEIYRLAQSEPQDVQEAVRRARIAQKTWANTPVSERAKVLLALKRQVLKKADAILDLITLENGKARAHANEEILDVCGNAAYYAKKAAEFLAPEYRHPAAPLAPKIQVEHLPVGVVGIISPWNYPFNLALSDALAALMAGNAVVLKPATDTPLCALAARALLLDSGLPPDLYQVVPGSGRVLGTALIDLVDKVMFTGSSAVGKGVVAQAGERLISASCELGGKNPMIVLPGIKVKQAVNATVAACFTNAGQICLSVERIYVHADVWDEYVPALVKAVGALKVAANFSWRNQMGPLINKKQLTTVQAHVQDAVDKGAKVIIGGHPLPKVSATAFAPTLLTDVPRDAALYKEETFGPVVALYKVTNAAEAVSLANDTVYGLNASVLGAIPLAKQVAEMLEAGSVNVNDGYASVFASVDAPAGGWKESGIGTRHGKEGIIAYTRTRSLAVAGKVPLNKIPSVPESWRARLLRLYMKIFR